MLKPGTVFILGAAVSAELGFPLGWKLRSDIQAMLNLDSGAENELVRTINLTLGDHGRQAAKSLKAALSHALSIDNLVEHHAADETFKQVAKLSIAMAISKAEERSIKVLSGDSAGMTYGEIFRLMVGGCGPERIGEALARVKFVTFNYDRSLEEFFYRALGSYSRLTPQAARTALGQIDILHVYGSLGPVTHGVVGPDRYGNPPDTDTIGGRAEDIRTFSESTDSGLASQIKDIVGNAETLIMLGCANHRRNMELLAPETTRFKSVYGTYYTPALADAHATPSLADYSLPGNLALRRAIYRWQPKSNQHRIGVDHMKVEPLTCAQLVLKYGSEWTE